MSDMFLVEREDDILVITMQAPNNNLMTDDFFVEYDKVMDRVRQEKNVKGLIIKGEGRHFSVGADVEGLAKRSKISIDKMQSEQDLPIDHIKQKSLFTDLQKLPFPVISVVTGFCIGSGCEIAINSDYRVCEASAKIGQPESTFGILPALGGIAKTVEVCGLANAMELVFSGELINAAKAYEIGWADIVCGKKEGLDKAFDLIREINVRDGR